MRPSTEWQCHVHRSLMGDFNHPDICWRDNTAGHEQSRKFTECTYHKFFFQVTKEPTRRVAVLDFILINKEGLRSEVQKQPSLQ